MNRRRNGSFDGAVLAYERFWKPLFQLPISLGIGRYLKSLSLPTGKFQRRYSRSIHLKLLSFFFQLFPTPFLLS
jgi:hypothetical protein